MIVQFYNCYWKHDAEELQINVGMYRLVMLVRLRVRKMLIKLIGFTLISDDNRVVKVSISFRNMKYEYQF